MELFNIFFVLFFICSLASLKSTPLWVLMGEEGGGGGEKQDFLRGKRGRAFTINVFVMLRLSTNRCVLRTTAAAAALSTTRDERGRISPLAPYSSAESHHERVGSSSFFFFMYTQFFFFRRWIYTRVISRATSASSPLPITSRESIFFFLEK